MGLSLEERGFLETVIDLNLKHAPEIYKTLSATKNMSKENFMYYVEGWLYGLFVGEYNIIHQNSIDSESRKELNEIVSRRVNEIIDKITEL